MKTKTYLKTSAAIFGIVSILHFLRLINGWQLTIGSYDISPLMSGIAAGVAAYLSLAALYILFDSPNE